MCFLSAWLRIWYRPSRDADFGVVAARDLETLIELLSKRGNVQVIERAKGTAHLNVDGIDVSIFVLPKLAPHTRDGALTVNGILATKTHAILDRGTRRDFFDLYVVLQTQKLGLLACLGALNEVYETDANHGLVLRALCYFDDAEQEAQLPGEGSKDWPRVREFFSKAVAALIVPPGEPLAIQANVVDVRSRRKAATRKTPTKPSRRTRK